MTIDLQHVRAETIGVNHRIHLNNAGAALVPTPVLDTMTAYLRREAEIGGYEAAGEQADRLDGVYSSVARLIGASSDEIALMENATIAWQMAFYAIRFRPSDRILTSQAEYGANYVAFLQVAKQTGAKIDVIPNDASGALCVPSLERMIDERVRLIAITWVPTNGGLVNPAAAVGKIARKAGVLYLLDACQAVGQMQVDVGTLGCDMLSATGRKFLRGPRGTGFLYVRRELMLQLEPPLIDHFGAEWVAPDRYELRRDARRFESWENNYAARLGLGVAIDYALSIGIEPIMARARLLADMMRDGLMRIPGVEIKDLGTERAAIVTFTVERADASDVKARLAAQGINVTTSQPSSTLLDAMARSLPTVVRASPHYYNSEEEVHRLIEAIAAIAHQHE
jgi:cysteine desulfurase/selenocysteine lyase